MSALPKDNIHLFTETIAKWHYSEWGKYHPELTEQDWINNSIDSIDTKKIIVATVNEKLVGSISLKKENMDNQFPDYGPWLSGLYICSEFRDKKNKCHLS
jgi:hypothetical protein